MQIDVLRPSELTAIQLNRWVELQATDITLDSPFLSPGWARAVERAQGPSGERVKVAVVSQDGEVRAFFPARVGPVTAMPAGAPMCDYQGLIALPGFEMDPRALVEALGVQRLDFSHMLEGQTSFGAHARGRSSSHLVDIANGYEAYGVERREAGTSILKDCDKKRRKVEREVGPVTFAALSRSATDFDQLVAWKREQLAQTRQTDIFDAGWTLPLMRDLFASRDPDSGGGLYSLYFGDKLAAVHLHLRGKKTVHGWLIAHDPAFERYSPGILLFQDILRWMAETGYQRLDLGPGDYRFKRELANASQGVTHGFVGRAAPAAWMRGAAYGVRAALEALPLGQVSQLPGKVMRRADILRGLRSA